MTMEMTMLTLSVALLLVLIMIQASAGVLAQGLEKMAGSRDRLGEPGNFQARTKRLVDNHREGMLLFAPLVIVAAISDVSTNLTVLGAQLFFYARVVHAVLYMLGTPWVRPLAWAVGIAGCVMIFIELIAAI